MATYERKPEFFMICCDKPEDAAEIRKLIELWEEGQLQVEREKHIVGSEEYYRGLHDRRN